MDQENQVQQLQSEMKSQEMAEFAEMVPNFVTEWNDWQNQANHQFEPQNIQIQNPGIMTNPANNQMSNSDMRVLGVDLDMLMQHNEPFYLSSNSTPPPSPDSSTATMPKMSFAGETKVRIGAPHHMACHDYTNKVNFWI